MLAAREEMFKFGEATRIAKKNWNSESCNQRFEISISDSNIRSSYGFVVGPVAGRPRGCVVGEPRPEGRVVAPASDGRVVAWLPVASVPPLPLLVLPPLGGVGLGSSLSQPTIVAPTITNDIRN